MPSSAVTFTKLSEYYKESVLTIKETLCHINGICNLLGPREITLIAQFSASFAKEEWAIKHGWEMEMWDNHLMLNSQDLSYEQIKTICSAIVAGAEFGHIIMAHNSIGNHGVTLISKALESRTKVERLCLDMCDIGVDGVKALSKAFEAGAQVSCLDLSFNNIGHVGTTMLAKMLSVANLRILVLNVCGIGMRGLASLAEALKACTKLENLDLTDESIGNWGAGKLAKALPKGNLKYLNISGNKIGVIGVRWLAGALRAGWNLTRLDLSSNSIGDIGAKLFSEALCSKNGLKDLLLSNCDIGDVGVKWISEALPAAKLEELVLSQNNIGDEGARMLAKALQSGAEVKVLNLRFTNIKTEGMRFFANALISGVEL